MIQLLIWTALYITTCASLVVWLYAFALLVGCGMLKPDNWKYWEKIHWYTLAIIIAGGPVFFTLVHFTVKAYRG